MACLVMFILFLIYSKVWKSETTIENASVFPFFPFLFLNTIFIYKSYY